MLRLLLGRSLNVGGLLITTLIFAVSASSASLFATLVSPLISAGIVVRLLSVTLVALSLVFISPVFSLLLKLTELFSLNLLLGLDLGVGLLLLLPSTVSVLDHVLDQHLNSG